MHPQPLSSLTSRPSPLPFLHSSYIQQLLSVPRPHNASACHRTSAHVLPHPETLTSPAALQLINSRARFSDPSSSVPGSGNLCYFSRGALILHRAFAISTPKFPFLFSVFICFWSGRIHSFDYLLNGSHLPDWKLHSDKVLEYLNLPLLPLTHQQHAWHLGAWYLTWMLALGCRKKQQYMGFPKLRCFVTGAQQ